IAAPSRTTARSRGKSALPLTQVAPSSGVTAASSTTPATARRRQQARKSVAERLARKELEEQIIEIELEPEESLSSVFEFVTGGAPSEDLGDSFQEFLSAMPGLSGPRKRSRQVSVKEARRLLTQEEANKLIDFDSVVEQATQRVEQAGVIFLDELDKVLASQGA